MDCLEIVLAIFRKIITVFYVYSTAIRILDDTYSATEADEALALTHELASIDIYSNSWGPSDDGETFSSLASIQREALQTGVTKVNVLL
jgi:hypothetical protein